MPQDSFIREKFTKERSAAKAFAKEYYERFPKDRYLTEVESWRHLQSANIEFTMKRLREPVGPDSTRLTPSEIDSLREHARQVSREMPAALARARARRKAFGEIGASDLER